MPRRKKDESPFIGCSAVRAAEHAERQGYATACYRVGQEIDHAEIQGDRHYMIFFYNKKGIVVEVREIC